MIINNKNVIGLYVYNPGEIYNQGDLIYHNFNLYLVLSEYKSDKSEPQKSPHCILYLRYLMDSGMINPSNVIDSNRANGLIQDKIKGLNSNGVLSGITIRTEDELINYRSTGVYEVFLNSKHYLMRVYNTGNGVIQELINPELPSIKYRIDHGSGYSSWNLIKNFTDPDINNLISETIRIRSSIESKYNHLISNTYRCQYLVVKPVNGNEYYFSNDTKDRFLKLILERRISNTEFDQFDITIDPTSFDEGTTNLTVNSKGIKISLIRITNSDGLKGFRVNIDGELSVTKFIVVNKIDWFL